MPTWAYQQIPPDQQFPDLLVQLPDLSLPLIPSRPHAPLEQRHQTLDRLPFHRITELASTGCLVAISSPVLSP